MSCLVIFTRQPLRLLLHLQNASLSMMTGMTWIERGPDGRFYFVRKRSKFPSARELLSDALAPLRRNSFSFSRFSRDQRSQPPPHLQTALPHAPLYLTAPHMQSAWHRLASPNQDPQAGQRLNTEVMKPTTNNNRNRMSRQSEDDNPRSILKPQPPTYPVPHPSMYPAPPEHVAAAQPPTFGVPYHNPMSSHMQQQIQHLQAQPHGAFPAQPHVVYQTHPQGTYPFQSRDVYSVQRPPGTYTAQSSGIYPLQPPGTYPLQPLPAGARVISPPRFPTTEELKYKCHVCGRFRSSRYHHKHPVPQGQLPGKTVCRKCREKATESEDSLSSDSANDRAGHHRGGRRSRSRSRAVSAEHGPRRSRSRRPRSRSGVEWSDDEYDEEVEIEDVRRSHSRSSSLDVEPLLGGRSRSRLRRARSPSVEMIRYVERPPRPTLTQRTVYVENDRPTGEEDYEWERSDGTRYRTSYRYVPSTIQKQVVDKNTSRTLSRPPPTAIHTIRRQSSDASQRAPLALESSEYFSGSYDSVPSSRSLPRARPRSRVVTVPYRRSQQSEYTSESDEGFYGHHAPSSYRRPRSLMGRGHGESHVRSGSRLFGNPKDPCP